MSGSNAGAGVSMTFEYDPAKSRGNRKKHGIDFKQAERMWEDPNLIELASTYTDEPRSLVIGTIRGRYWTAIITYRNENVRIISVRPSRKEEKTLYERRGE